MGEQTRVRELERENAELRAEIDRLRVVVRGIQGLLAALDAVGRAPGTYE